MRLRYFLFIVFTIAAAGCGGRKQHQSLRVLNAATNTNLPSASGITAFKDRFLINADNGSFIYVVDGEGRLTDSIALLHENPAVHIVPKPQKSDYEAATQVFFHGNPGVVLFGSGSLSPHRDSAALLQLPDANNQRKADLRPLYTMLIRAGIPAKSLNIEAAAATTDVLMLFNRGDNSIAFFNCDSLLDAVFNGAPLPRPILHRISLPKTDSFNVGISGATMLDDSTVLFCGSVEATTDWAKDGAILGSGVGFLRVSKYRRPTLLRWTMLNMPTGKLMAEKLEGIELLRREKNAVIVRCVTDNDNGSSGVIDLEVEL